MVQTEIGPLPGDLWALIGEAPPTSEAVPAPQSVEVEYPVAETTSQAPPGPLSTASKREAIVQRADIRTDETPDARAERGQESEEGIDIDELVHRVYGEVRRRLAVELERMRSHF
jgi:hypothetical protein